MILTTKDGRPLIIERDTNSDAWMVWLEVGRISGMDIAAQAGSAKAMLDLIDQKLAPYGKSVDWTRQQSNFMAGLLISEMERQAKEKDA